MTQTAARPLVPLRVHVETLATRPAVRFLSGFVRFYLAEGLGLDADAPQSVRVRLAIVEVVTNVVRHGYAGADPGPVSVSLSRDGDRITCVVADRAPRFDPLEAGNARLPGSEDLATSGYGLGIVAEVMDEVSHRYEPSTGNELTMTVSLRS